MSRGVGVATASAASLSAATAVAPVPAASPLAASPLAVSMPAGASRALDRDFLAYVDEKGHVAYARWKADGPARARLHGFVRTLTLEPTTLARWVDLYNLVVLDAVLDAYPMASVKDIGAPPEFALFKTRRFAELGGEIGRASCRERV